MRRKKLYLLIVIAIAAVFGIKYLASLGNTAISEGEVSLVRNQEWNSIISSSVNRNLISLDIDGTSAVINQDDIYMDNDMNIMISCKKLTQLLSCAVNCYDNYRVIIEKGNNKIELQMYSKEATVNDEKVSMLTTAVHNEDGIFVPLKFVCKYLSYDYNWDSEKNAVKMTNKKPDEKIFPFYYDYRDYGKITHVKNQANLGTCWAFASLTALETSLLPEQKEDFSEDHMTCHNGYNLSQSEGGEYTMAMAYLASWKGPVAEKDDPYGDGISPNGLLPMYHVQEIQIIESKNLDNIKKAVFLYGGVQSSLYMSIWDADNHNSEYYSVDNNAYCYIGTEKANHDIVIVGWDDSYSAVNFPTEPEGDGAFICVNSWGEQFGESGYFYISYYDSNIGLHNLVYTGVENTDNYDHIYQSDLCGWVGQLGYNREYAYFANVYTAEHDEMLKAVSFYATGTDTEYEVYFVDNYTDTASFSNKLMVAKGSFSNAGYYTVNLTHERKLEAGKKYGIVVNIKTPNSIHPIAIEYHSDASTSTVDVSDGEGYISLHGTLWEHVEDTQKCNICLKMFTGDIDKSEDE